MYSPNPKTEAQKVFCYCAALLAVLLLSQFAVCVGDAFDAWFRGVWQ